MLSEKILRMNRSKQRRQIESLGLSLASHRVLRGSHRK